MALLPTGSDRLLEIRTAVIDIVIKSKGKQNTGAWQMGAGSSSLKVIARNLERVSIPAQDITEQFLHCFLNRRIMLSRFRQEPVNLLNFTATAVWSKNG